MESNIELKISDNYLFVVHNWLNVTEDDFIKRYEFRTIFNERKLLTDAIYGNTNFLSNSLDFRKIDDIKDTNIDHIEFKWANSINVEIECYLCNLENFPHSYLESTVYLFKFKNEDIYKVLECINFDSHLESVINLINEKFIINLETRKLFNIKNCSSLFYLEPNDDISLFNTKRNIKNSIIELRNSIQYNHSYQEPYLIKDLIIDSNSLLINPSPDSFVTFGTNKIENTEKNYFFISHKAKDFLEYLLQKNKLHRYENELKEFDIFKLKISDYLKKPSNSKYDIPDFFKNEYLKEKQLSSSKRIEYNLQLSLIDKRIKESYSFIDFNSYVKTNNIELYPDKPSYPVGEKLIENYENLLFNLNTVIGLIKSKEEELSEAFRDLTTITTNELNLLLQRNMKNISLLAIFLTAFLAFKTELIELLFPKKDAPIETIGIGFIHKDSIENIEIDTVTKPKTPIEPVSNDSVKKIISTKSQEN